jgi:hypothetical protein
MHPILKKKVNNASNHIPMISNNGSIVKEKEVREIKCDQLKNFFSNKSHRNFSKTSKIVKLVYNVSKLKEICNV